MAKKKRAAPRPRTVNRERARDEARGADKLVALREKLAATLPGGSAAMPLPVPSAAVIAARATAEPCAACGQRLRVREHDVMEGEAGLLRRVTRECTACGRASVRYFQIAPPLLH